MKSFLKKHLTQDSFVRWLLRSIRKYPILWVVSFFRSLWATKLLSGNFWPVLVRISPGQKLTIHKHKSSKSRLAGVLSVNTWGGNSLPSSIILGKNSVFDMDGDFEIGPNVHIGVNLNGKLHLGGKKFSSASGITCNTRVMVEDCIVIGHDSIIAWDVLITDSDWHEVKGSKRTEPVFIGNNVWISHGASILKGSKIPAGCIVGAKSLVSKSFDVENSLIAGVPAKIIKNNVEWTR